MLRWIATAALGAAMLSGCGPEIGDDCKDSLDCSTDGTRFCDFTQPDGYCLIPECRADECPEEALCVSFGLDEQARSFCMRHCEDNGDCRGGYECTEPDQDAEIPSEIVDLAPQGSRFCVERAPSP